MLALGVLLRTTKSEAILEWTNGIPWIPLAVWVSTIGSYGPGHPSCAALIHYNSGILNKAQNDVLLIASITIPIQDQI